MSASGGASPVIPPVDLPLAHPFAFVFMFLLMLVFGIGRVAKETKTSVKWQSFLNFWMLSYLLVLGLLMAVTTSIALCASD